jgi:hypothetical protein
MAAIVVVPRGLCNMGPWSNERIANVDPTHAKWTARLVLQRQRYKVIRLAQRRAHGWLSNIMWN